MVNPEEKRLNPTGEVGGNSTPHTPPSLGLTGPAGFTVVSPRAWDVQVGGDRRRVKLGRRVPFVGTHSSRNNFKGE